jgi:7-keto-8-aminopelargonate synthetase-like enzyme
LSSYNYLGLANHPEVKQAAIEAIGEFGVGPCGSAILAGRTRVMSELEDALAQKFQHENCMVYNSGYSGGIGNLIALLRRGDVAILDEKAHMCLIDGVKAAKARLEFFTHNDVDSLEKVLKTHADKRKLVVVEGVYSMDGDIAALDKILPVAEHFKTPVLIDEAHSILVYGKHGRGVTEHFECQDRIAVQFAGFSKAFGASGAFSGGRRDLINYIRTFSNTHGFSVALPAVIAAAANKALEIATRDDTLRSRLWENVAYFRRHATEMGLDLGQSVSQVFPIIIGDGRELLFTMTDEMEKKGLLMVPVDYPSVPMTELRYRVTITAMHTRADLDEALSILKDVVIKKIGRRT